MSEEIANAMNVIKKAIKDDGREKGSYSDVWISNIAMMCHDAIVDYDSSIKDPHLIANEAACRCMRLFFAFDLIDGKN